MSEAETTTTPAPEPAPAPAADWLAGMGDAEREVATRKHWSGPADAIKAYASAEKMIGRDPATMLTLPSAPDDEAAWGAVYGKLGRPDTPDGYKLPDEAKSPMGDDHRKEFLDRAHKLGLSGRQAEAAWAHEIALTEKALGHARAAIFTDEAAAEAELRKAWGQGFDTQFRLAGKALQVLGGDDLGKKLEAAGLENDPLILKAFAKVGGMLSEQAFHGGDGRSFGYTPDQARSKIAELQRDKEFMKSYQDKRHPAHADAVQRMASLHDAAYAA